MIAMDFHQARQALLKNHVAHAQSLIERIRKVGEYTHHDYGKDETGHWITHNGAHIYIQTADHGQIAQILPRIKSKLESNRATKATLPTFETKGEPLDEDEQQQHKILNARISHLEDHLRIALMRASSLGLTPTRSGELVRGQATASHASSGEYESHSHSHEHTGPLPWEDDPAAVGEEMPLSSREEEDMLRRRERYPFGPNDAEKEAEKRYAKAVEDWKAVVRSGELIGSTVFGEQMRTTDAALEDYLSHLRARRKTLEERGKKSFHARQAMHQVQDKMNAVTSGRDKLAGILRAANAEVKTRGATPSEGGVKPFQWGTGSRTTSTGWSSGAPTGTAFQVAQQQAAWKPGPMSQAGAAVLGHGENIAHHSYHTLGHVKEALNSGGNLTALGFHLANAIHHSKALKDSVKDSTGDVKVLGEEAQHKIWAARRHLGTLKDKLLAERGVTNDGAERIREGADTRQSLRETLRGYTQRRDASERRIRQAQVREWQRGKTSEGSYSSMPSYPKMPRKSHSRHRTFTTN